MSGPSRRRNPIITRGKKSDKKKKKMEAQNRNVTAPKDSFTELRQGMDSQRKELIKGNSPKGDKGILSEPSPLFFDRTENIRSKKKDGYGMAILLEEPGYNDGVDISKVKQERMLVINGKRPSIFQDLPRQYKELEENLKQQEKESRTEVLDRGRKREEQNKKNAAKEAEKRRVEKEKLEAQRREEIEVKKREDAIKLAKSQAIEQERLDLQRKEKIEAERREELLRLEEATRLQEREQERLDLQRKEKIEVEGLVENRTVFSPKQGFLHRLWKKIKNAILSKKSNQKNRLQEEVLLVGETVKQIDEIEEPEEVLEVVEVETLVEEVDVQEEVPVIEDTVQQIVEIEEPEEVLVIREALQQIDVIEEVETETLVEEIEVQEEVLVVKDTVQQIIEIEEPEEVLEEVEVETLVEEIDEEVLVVKDTVQQIIEIEEPEEVLEVVEVETLVEEIDVQEEVFVVEDTVQQIIEIEEPEEVLEEVEVETLVEEIEVQEEVLVVEEPLPHIVEIEEPEEDIEELPDFETGEVLLADLRITIKDEPLPIEFILKVLMEKHGLGKKDVNILIDHIASPFSICKTMKGDLFERFIESFDEQNSQSSGVEIWTQIIQIIGLDSLSADQQVEIYNLFMGDKKKVNQKVRTLAILYHFIPMKFERWWQKEMIDSFTTKKYNSDYIYYQGKNFSEEIVEEARMLICAYAIEKPGLVAKAYTSAKHQAGKHHENRTERWLKKVAGKIEYLTEAEIQKFGGQKYGNKHVSTKITPDILLKKPIKLSKEGQHIHWIDAKKHFIDPALSPEYRVDSFCNQLEKYVRAYGPGLIVWGKDFSEEWNDATKGVVQHIKI